MKTPLLEMKGISKHFPGVVALNSVDLEVNPGEIVALIGENGAGKSTLMKILGGILAPDGGHLRIDGQPVIIRSVSDAVRLGVGFIHQELNLFDNLDVAGNIFFGREPVWGGPLRLIDRRAMCAQTEPYLRLLGLDLSSRTPLSKLSLAQQQMVEIAKALSLCARILIMDEPTSSLTLTETERLLEAIKELKSQGVSIIYISHRLSEVQGLADRVVVLRDGANAGELSREEISNDRMIRLMVGRDLEDFYVHSAARQEQPYFEVQGVRTRRYPRSAVSFEVRQGEIFCLAGLVGAGRTEVAQAIFGIEPALEGTIHLNKAPVNVLSPQDAIAHGIYMIPEDRRRLGLIVDMSVRENITLPALPRYAVAGLIAHAAEQKAAAAICDRLRVRTRSIETKVANLSGGNQQKVVLAKWLALEPKVLLLDEPTCGMDVGAKAEVYALMRGLAESGVSLVVISSDMEEVLGISDRVAVMHQGRITGLLERDQCSEEAIMRLAVG